MPKIDLLQIEPFLQELKIGSLWFRKYQKKLPPTCTFCFLGLQSLQNQGLRSTQLSGSEKAKIKSGHELNLLESIRLVVFYTSVPKRFLCVKRLQRYGRKQTLNPFWWKFNRKKKKKKPEKRKRSRLVLFSKTEEKYDLEWNTWSIGSSYNPKKYQNSTKNFRPNFKNVAQVATCWKCPKFDDFQNRFSKHHSWRTKGRRGLKFTGNIL